MTEIVVATEELFYCSSEDARHFAVEALLTSKNRDIDFYDAYYGLLSFQLIDWMERNLDELDGPVAAKLFSKVMQTEKARSYLDRKENTFMKLLHDEIVPLGCVLHEMCAGSNKENAMAKAKDILSYQKLDGIDLASLPKSTKHLSKRKLERLWATYSEVPHYVWLSSLNSWRATAGIELVSFAEGRECWGQIMSAFESVSQTKKISVPEPQFLRFTTVEAFQELGL